MIACSSLCTVSLSVLLPSLEAPKSSSTVFTSKISSSSSALATPKLHTSKANANQRQAAPIVDVKKESLCNWTWV